jgi:hypothetical protein
VLPVSTTLTDNYVDSINMASHAVSVMRLSDKFQEEIKQALPHDPTFRSIYRALTELRTGVIKRGKPVHGREWTDSSEEFTLKEDGLLYCVARNRDQLCIPGKLQQTAFKITHDDAGHAGVDRAIDMMRQTMFTRNLRRNFIDYIRSCPACQVVKPSHEKPFSSLKPLTTPSRPFKVMTIDFIVSLPIAGGFNAVMTVTCKFSKLIHIITGRESMSVQEWAQLFFDQVVRYRQKPTSIVSDRDVKFTSAFWKALLEKYEIGRCLTTAYHPAADG